MRGRGGDLAGGAPRPEMVAGVLALASTERELYISASRCMSAKAEPLGPDVEKLES